MRSWKRHLVTAALPYANGPVHIGHLAGVYIPADIYTRYLQEKGEEVLFVCGSDEHGVPITLKARKEGKSPQEIVDHYHLLMQDSFRDFGISFSVYSRTTSAVHHQTASAFFRKLYDDNKFIVRETEQFFDTSLNQFLADRYITGTCPKCSSPGAYGDQCEKCGTSLDPNDLIDPLSALSGTKPVKKPTRNWYLPLDQYQQRIHEFLQTRENWKPGVMGQCLSWLNEGDGLQPRSMTRDLDWGVPVPLPDAQGKVLYVWFDAPIGYISNTIEYFQQKPGHENDWKLYWQDDHTRLIHFIGKDNIVFHCIIFPSMLMEHGGYILPDQVPGNEFLNLEGRKISTSKNWAVWLHEYLHDFPGRQDELRYVLTSIMPETKDSEFTWKDFQTRVNAELVGILGNLVNRVLVLTGKYYEGIVPDSGPCSELADFLTEKRNNMDSLLSAFRFREALQECMQIARHGNRLLTEKEPWKTFKTDPKATAAVLYDGLQILGALSIALRPFLPFTAQRLADMLAISPLQYSWNDLCRQDLLPVGHRMGTPSLLFDKIEDDAITFQIKKLLNMENKPQEVAPSVDSQPEKQDTLKPEISIDDFSKVQLLTGTVLKAQKVEKADKLLQLEIDLGFEVRTVLSGIALHFSPEEVIGRQVVVVANLAPRKMRGIESKGMILMAQDEQGKLVFVSPAVLTNNGAEVK